TLLGHVPVAVARADPVGDLEAARDPLLTEDVVHVLREALDGARADAVEHRGERELASLPELGDAPLEAIADRAQRGDDLLDRSPALSDLRDPERHATSTEEVPVLAGDGEPAHDGARFHQRAPEGERLVEEPPHLGAGEVRVALVALEAQDLDGVDLEGDVREDAGLGRGALARHAPRRPAARTTLIFPSPRAAGPQPRDALRLAPPSSSPRLGRRGPSPATPCGSHDCRDALDALGARAAARADDVAAGLEQRRVLARPPLG